jgi:HAD superfamily hydrolase (TIGR01549 family)
MRALGFDFGQTLAELDYEFVAKRLRERGAPFDPRLGRENSKPAWDIYGQKKNEGHVVAWQAMMQAQLEGGGLPRERAPEIAAWLWDEQPRKNLWRRPIPGMIELVRELRRAGAPIAIVSNSEGHLAELVDELGWSADFDVVVDSGRLGIDKPDPRIFQHACAALSVPPHELLHVGDAWEADVQGALGASASAVWFDARHRERALPERVYGASNASELREVLARLELLR